MAGAGIVILFVVSLVGLTIFSLIYLTVASHYFLTTITESSAGNDEVQYPREGIIEWWWKPLFVVWVLAFWIIPTAALCAPLASISPRAAIITFVAVIWVLYPLSLSSALATQNWFFFVHPVIFWRMLRHFLPLVYVHLMTLAAAGACAWFLYAAWTQTFLWAIPAALAIPTATLFYARHWGRFAWLSLNFVPRKKSTAPEPKKPASDTDTVPEMDIEEIDEGVREGLPPSTVGSFKANTPTTSGGQGAAATYQVENDQAEMETKPYMLVDDPTKPNFQESNDEPTFPLMPSVAKTTTAPPPALEEDEWATQKKPYELIGDADFKPTTPPDLDQKPEADRPISVSKHLDDQVEREKEKNRKRQAEDGVMNLPKLSKRTPDFGEALFFGVWRFMVYERTLSAWFGLVVLTSAELFFLFLLRMFMPQTD